jgi:hypothetical protein
LVSGSGFPSWNDEFSGLFEVLNILKRDFSQGGDFVGLGHVGHGDFFGGGEVARIQKFFGEFVLWFAFGELQSPFHQFNLSKVMRELDSGTGHLVGKLHGFGTDFFLRVDLENRFVVQFHQDLQVWCGVLAEGMLHCLAEDRRVADIAELLLLQAAFLEKLDDVFGQTFYAIGPEPKDDVGMFLSTVFHFADGFAVALEQRLD